MKHSVSVVIPVYNSEKTLQELNKMLVAVLEKTSSSYEIIMVDDGSRDNSYDMMQKLYKEYKGIKIIRLDGNYGQQNAILCGLNYATGDYIGTIDDDLQNPPEELEKLIDELDKGFDAVYGIPVKKRHSLFRNFGTFMTDIFFNIVFSKPINIRISSFRIIKKELVQKIIKDETPFIYISAIIFKNKALVSNVPVMHEVRKIGSSNYNLKKLLKLYFKLFINYSIFSIFIKREKVIRYKVKNACL